MANGLLSLSSKLPGFSPGSDIEIDGHRLDPALGAILALAGKARLHSLPPGAARQRLASLDRWVPKAQVAMERVEDKVLKEPGEDIRIRCYTPMSLGALAKGREHGAPPALVYFHGGGWVLGDLETSDSFCRLLAAQTPCIVFSVDYRLAPEHPFPAGLGDAKRAFEWIRSHADELGVDPRRVAIGGDSAGGNLAAVLAAGCQADDHPGPGPFAQVLIYPVTCAPAPLAVSRIDPESGAPWRRSSYESFRQGFGLEQRTMEYFFGHYLGARHPAESEDPRVSPLLAEDFSSLPPTIVATAGFDILRDEGDAYAECLRRAGADVKHLRFPTMCHSFAYMSGLSGPRRAIDEIISCLAEIFRRPMS